MVPLHVHAIVIKPPVVGVPHIPVAKIFIIHIDITGCLTIQVQVFFLFFICQNSSKMQMIGFKQGGEGRVSKAENLRSSSAIQSIFNLLGRTGKIIIFIIQVGI